MLRANKVVRMTRLQDRRGAVDQGGFGMGTVEPVPKQVLCCEC